MVDFRLSEEQQMIRDGARRFAREVIQPAAAHHDETGEFPVEICRQAWELGYMNTHVPESLGGMGWGCFEGALLAEEFGHGCAGITTAMEANHLAEQPLIVAGSEAVQERFLAPMIDQFQMASYAVTEPGAGSDVAGIKTLAVQHGDDWVINGEKMWITNAAKAHWFFVLAYTDPSQKHRGMTGFVVPSDLPGVQVGKKEVNMGQRASDTRGVAFQDVKIPDAWRVGEVGRGFEVAMKAFDFTRPTVSSIAVGLARRALDESVKHAREREAFGRPIAKFQGISFMLADMAKSINASRLLVWHSAWKIDNGMSNVKEAAMAKCFAADEAMRIAVDAVQVFGGYGFNTEFPVEKLMRDAKIFQIYEGTSQIQRLIIAREILR